MVNVELFGLFRLDTGIKAFDLDVAEEGIRTVKDVYPVLLRKAKEVNPATKINSKDIDGCIILVNGVQTKKGHALNDGDKLQLMSPVCGG